MRAQALLWEWASLQAQGLLWEWVSLQAQALLWEWELPELLQEWRLVAKALKAPGQQRDRYP
jgi:hypothetical protein